MTKRRMAVLAILTGLNGLIPTPAAADAGGCWKCYGIGGPFLTCGEGWDQGYSSCGGGMPYQMPCVNGAFTCPFEP